MYKCNNTNINNNVNNNYVPLLLSQFGNNSSIRDSS